MMTAGSTLLSAQEPERVENRFRGSMRRSPVLVEEVEIGLEGPEEQLFFRPTNLILDGDGNVYVPDGSQHSILVFESDGDFLRSIGGEGQGPGEITMPDQVYLAWNGEVVVPDMMNQRTTYFSRNGEFLRSESMGGGGNIMIFTGAGGQIPTVSGEYLRPGPPVLPMNLPGMEQSNAPPKLLETVDERGRVIRSFGERWTHEDPHLANILNQIAFDYHPAGKIAVAPAYFDEIHLYDATSGEVEKIIRRRTAFTPREPAAELQEEQSPDGREIRVQLVVNADPISIDVAFDAAGRIWVLTWLVAAEERETREEEGAFADMIRLEVFSPAGELLTGIPLEEPATRIAFGPGGELWLLDTEFAPSARRYRVDWP